MTTMPRARNSFPRTHAQLNSVLFVRTHAKNTQHVNRTPRPAAQSERKRETKTDQEMDTLLEGEKRERASGRVGEYVLPSTTTWQRGHNTAATCARGHSAFPMPFRTPPRCRRRATILFPDLRLNIEIYKSRLESGTVC